MGHLSTAAELIWVQFDAVYLLNKKYFIIKTTSGGRLENIKQNIQSANIFISFFAARPFASIVLPNHAVWFLDSVFWGSHIWGGGFDIWCILFLFFVCLGEFLGEFGIRGIPQEIAGINTANHVVGPVPQTKRNTLDTMSLVFVRHCVSFLATGW